MGYQIGFSLLDFFQRANDDHPDEYGVAHLCYLLCLLVSLIFYFFISIFYPMVKWCNEEMITDGAVMMVIIFRRGD